MCDIIGLGCNPKPLGRIAVGAVASLRLCPCPAVKRQRNSSNIEYMKIMTNHLNGTIMSADRVVGTVKDGLLVGFDKQRLPLYLLHTKDVQGWLCGRAIDSHRTNSRLLKKALRIGTTDDLEAVLQVHGATITDDYWYKADGENITYSDVKFTENQFAELALRGDPDSFNKAPSRTPELTNTGSFEKCWRLIEGRWNMVKRGDSAERFAEIFISKLGTALGFPMAEYSENGDTVVSPDFTNGKVNFESADGLVGDDEDYEKNFQVFYSLSSQLAKEYLQIIYLDTLCFNMDRHTKNYGVLRDKESGEIISLAPNFDNNIALFSRGVPKDISRQNDKLLELFVEFLESNDEALQMAEQLPVPTEQMIDDCIMLAGGSDDAAAVKEFVMSGNVIIQAESERLMDEELTLGGQNL